MVARTDQGRGAGGANARVVRNPDRGFTDLVFLHREKRMALRHRGNANGPRGKTGVQLAAVWHRRECENTAPHWPR